ncbi:MAG TPA: hypothetical protein VNR11_11200 [Xanthobacteraceae bacterium]|nr:hypothetical protein [Xanthobacteraceae bacterium]
MEAMRKRVAAGNPADLDQFVSAENIARYRRLLDTDIDDEQRRTILQLLADQVSMLRYG